MKKKFLSMFLMLLAGVFVFAGCTSVLTGGPKLTDEITSNGGLVVRKGNYLYYANAYQSTEGLKTGDNKLGSVKLSSLYRAELDNDGKLKYDKDKKLTGVDVVVKKVVGFERGGFYIFDDKIYFASPNDEKDKQGNVDFKKLDFYSVNLDGTDVNRIYKTETGSENIKYEFYKFGGTVYLAVFDSANLYVINVNTKSVKQIAKDVDSVALPKVNEYVCSNSKDKDIMTDAEKYVYYTRKAVEEDNSTNGNVLCMASLVDNKEVIISKNSTFKAVEFKSDNLVYTKKDLNSTSDYYYVAPIVDKNLDLSKEEKLTQKAFTDPLIILNFENGNYRGILTKNTSGYLTVIKPIVGGMPEFEVLNEEVSLTPIKVVGDDVYAYNQDNELYVINYKTKVLKQLTNKENEKLNFAMSANFDNEGRYVYAYREYVGDKEDDKGYYLVRIDVLGDEIVESEVMSEVLKEHTKTENKDEATKEENKPAEKTSVNA